MKKMKVLDSLSKFSDTSLTAEESTVSWGHVSRSQTIGDCHQRTKPRTSKSDTSPIRYKFSELSVATNESTDWWCQAISRNVRGDCPDIKVQGLWQRTPSVRDETWRYQEAEKQVMNYPRTDDCFGFHPPAAPVTVLLRNSQGSWIKLEALGPKEYVDQVWITPRIDLYSRPPMAAPAGKGAAPRGARRVVRRLLRELIASLPLLSSDDNKPKVTKSGSPVKPPRNAVSPARAVCSHNSLPRLRSISVQTQAPSDKFQYNSPCCETRSFNCSKVEDRCKGKKDDSWAGGVRALRDSHVRLVLRQLRQIERLNRALDRRMPGPDV